MANMFLAGFCAAGALYNTCIAIFTKDSSHVGWAIVGAGLCALNIIAAVA